MYVCMYLLCTRLPLTYINDNTRCVKIYFSQITRIEMNLISISVNRTDYGRL